MNSSDGPFGSDTGPASVPTVETQIASATMPPRSHRVRNCARLMFRMSLMPKLYTPDLRL